MEVFPHKMTVDHNTVRDLVWNRLTENVAASVRTDLWDSLKAVQDSVGDSLYYAVLDTVWAKSSPFRIQFDNLSGVQFEK